MKKIKQPGLLTLVLLITMSCTKLPLYQSKNILDKETNKLRYYDADGKIMYDVFNDDKNVYVKMQTSDFIAQVKILRLGFTLWLDKDGKKSRDKGIVFPQKQSWNSLGRSKDGRSSQQQNQTSEKQKQQMKQLQEQFRASPKNMVLVGMDEKGSRTIVNSEMEKSDIQVSISFSVDNTLHYEAIIPIKKIFIETRLSDSVFSIGFESGYAELGNSGMPSEGGTRSGGRGSGMGRGGMAGGAKGGGGRPDGNKAQNDSRSALSEPIKIWFKIKLK